MNGRLLNEWFQDREICIYLPPSYNIRTEGFPVVYIHDEGYLFRDQLPALESMMSRQELRELIFVGIRPDNRNCEYTPWYAKALSARYGELGGQGAQYLEFLANELKPYIDNTYRTLSSPENTGIAGASFGGLISMYAAFLLPGVFGRVASISGSFWYEGFIEFMKATGIEMTGRKIYLDVGMLEGAAKTNIQQTMVERNKEAYEILRQKGFSSEHCRFVMEEGADHEHTFFLRRLPFALQWLFQLPN